MPRRPLDRGARFAPAPTANFSKPESAQRRVHLPSRSLHRLSLRLVRRGQLRAQCQTPAQNSGATSICHIDHFSKDPVGGDPSIYAAPVVANLKTAATDRLDEMQILAAPYAA